MKDNVLRRDPFIELAGQTYAKNLGRLQLPGSADQGLHGIGAADADGDGAQAARIGRVAVGSQHHETGHGVVLQHGLMDDASAGRPEVYPVFPRCRLEEVKDLFVRLDTGRQVVLGTALAHDQMVAVDAGGDRRLGEVAGHELQEGHLGRGILHVHPVGLEL